MNIIHLVRAVTWGGGERYALDLCRKSIEAGHYVTAVTRGKPLIDEQFAEAGANVTRMPLGGFADFRSPLLLARLIKELGCNDVIIHVHTFKDAEIVARTKRILGKGTNVKLVCTRHLVKRAKRSQRWKFIFSAIDSLIFVSDLAKTRFLSANPQIDKKKIEVIHNSILIPDKFITPLPPPESKPLKLLYTGRIASEKGIDILIDALSLLPDLPLVLLIAGTGKEEYVNHLKSLAASRNISHRIEWIGFFPVIYEAIVKADICIAPSIVEESFGLTVIEYMSQARPVITTSNGGQKEIITDGKDGILVKPSDPEALAAAIRNLASDRSLREKMGDEAFHTFAQRFSYDIFFSKIMDVYNAVENS